MGTSVPRADGEARQPLFRIVSLLLLVLGVLGGMCSKTPVPPDLIGKWTASSPTYEGRYLEISEDAVVFGTGRGTLSFHLITDVEAEPDDEGSTRYTLHYDDDDGAPWALELRFQPGDPATLRIGHRDEIWALSENLASYRGASR